MIEILNTTPAQGYEAVFINIHEGHYYTEPVVLWATIKKKEITKIVGAVLGDNYEEGLFLIENNDSFWRYQSEGTNISNKEAEAEEEIEFQRKFYWEELTGDFLGEAIQQNFISNYLADKIADSISYPFKISEKDVYTPGAIALHLHYNGIDTLKDQPQSNEIVKELYGHWFSWKQSEEEYKFNRETETDASK